MFGGCPLTFIFTEDEDRSIQNILECQPLASYMLTIITCIDNRFLMLTLINYANLYLTLNH